MKHFLITALFCYALFQANAQTHIASPNDKVGLASSSIEAGGVQQQSSFNVNQSTGIVQLGYPLASLSTDELSMSVNLAYSTQGIRVEERAAWTGLGWALLAGGQINRVVKGWPDEFDVPDNIVGSNDDRGAYGQPNGGFLQQGGNVPTTYGSAQHDIARRSTVGRLDTQPDEFHFSFNGRSGMFVLDNSNEFITVPFQNIKIENTTNFGIFTIIDENGNKYVFAEQEISESDNSCNTSIASWDNRTYPTTWLLTKIYNAANETLFTLTYQANTSPTVTSKTFYTHIDRVGPEYCPDDNYSCTITTENYVKHISSIVCNKTGAWLEFVKGAFREDVPTDKYLDKIKVYSAATELSYQVQFSYSYFTSTDGTNTKRLKLNSCSILNANNESQNPTMFEYHENVNLPAHGSVAQDHWGFYNGKNYWGLIDYDSPSDLVNSRRTPNFSYSKANSIKKVINPSGSFTEFTFEQNTYSERASGYVSNPTISDNVSATAPSGNTVYSEYFEVIVPALYTFPIQISPSCNGVYGSVAILKLTSSGETLEADYVGGVDYLTDTWNKYLTPGQYRLRAIAASDACANQYHPTWQFHSSLSTDVSFHEGVTDKIRLAGGLRISQIRVSDGDADSGNDVYNKYDYTSPLNNDRSSGYLLAEPSYGYSIGTGLIVLEDSANGENCEGDSEYDIQEDYHHECNLNNWFSESRVPLLAAGGGYVAYRYVKESNCSSASLCDQGYTLTEFSIETSPTVNVKIAESTPYKHWKTGLPINSKVFKIEGNTPILISESSGQYINSGNAGSSRLMIAGINQSIYESLTGENIIPTCGIWHLYDGQIGDYQSDIYVPWISTTKFYSEAEFVESSKTIVYNSAYPWLPYSVQTHSNDPVTPYQVQRVKYVGDYVVSANGDAMTTALNYLLNTGEFGLNTPVETITLQGTSLNDLKVIGGSINTFKMQGGKVVADATYKLELTSPVNWSSAFFSSVSGNNFVMNGNYRKIAHVSTYDSQERPTSSQKENDILTTVIRDYSDGRVAAEVVNATPEKCAYTSFETDNGGGWTYYNQWTTTENSTVLGFTLAKAKTGTRKYSLQGGGGNPKSGSR